MEDLPQPGESPLDRPAFNNWIQSLCRYPGLFMTGTDTGVGKTWVGTQLLQLLRQQGLQVAPRKPVESGWIAEQLTETDSWKLAIQADGFQTVRHVCPNPLRLPLSPPRAAELEGKTLRIAELVAQCQERLRDGQFLYVEGAGGFYSPLAHDGLNADLAVALQLPVLLVSADRVGCINHILLTAAAIRQRGLTLAGVILNPIHPAPTGMDNLQDLRSLLDAPVLRWPTLT